jgi:hypothetical protein
MKEVGAVRRLKEQADTSTQKPPKPNVMRDIIRKELGLGTSSALHLGGKFKPKASDSPIRVSYGREGITFNSTPEGIKEIAPILKREISRIGKLHGYAFTAQSPHPVSFLKKYSLLLATYSTSIQVMIWEPRP